MRDIAKSSRCWAASAAALLSSALILLALTASPAGAVTTLPFKEYLGPAAQPTFTHLTALAFDQAEGDLLAFDSTTAQEKQELRIEAASGLGGTYKLSFEGQVTGWEGEATLAGGEAGSGDVTGASGTGKITNGSTEITEVATTSGAFAVGYPVEGEAFAGASLFEPGTTITAVDAANHTLTISQPAKFSFDKRNFRAGFVEVANVSGGPFTAGRAIAGEGIQPGTTIASCSPSCASPISLTLSKVAIDTATGVALNAGSLEATGLQTTAGKLSEGEEMSGTGILPGTTVTAVNEGAGTFTLSKPPTIAGASTDLSADLPAAAGGEVISKALQKLSTIGAGKVLVAGSGTASPVLRTIEFQGSSAQRLLSLLGCDSSGLTGASPACAIARLQAGHPIGLFRYSEDGAPAPFSALGTNVIDGKRGPGGLPCAEEAASCDETPQKTLEEDRAEEVAVDRSGTATEGNIYVAQPGTFGRPPLVDIFASDGHYLGQITKYTEKEKEKAFASPVTGVAVDSAGALYVADEKKVHKYVAQGAPHSPLTNADNVANFTVSGPYSLAAGVGPTAGSLFVAKREGPVFKIDSTSGEVLYEVVSGSFPGSYKAAVNPENGRVFVTRQAEPFVNEYDASGPAGATLVSQAPLPAGAFDVAIPPALPPPAMTSTLARAAYSPSPSGSKCIRAGRSRLPPPNPPPAWAKPRPP